MLNIEHALRQPCTDGESYFIFPNDTAIVYVPGEGVLKARIKPKELVGIPEGNVRDFIVAVALTNQKKY